VPGNLFAVGLRPPGDLPLDMIVAEVETFTSEQQSAIEARSGELFLDAAAGSGKTSVLVERFVRAVVEDGVEVGAILTITFTDKAAAQMRDRIRARLRELGAEEAARATEGAFISTIHGFCARVLRTHALAAGLDPAFTVLDELEAGRLADTAFETALAQLAERQPRAVDLLAAYGSPDLRASVQAVYGQLRSRGERRPRLPAPALGQDPAAARRELVQAAGRLAAELGALAEPSLRVREALERLSRVEGVADGQPWPGELDRLRLPSGNGHALTTAACADYGAALARLRSAWEERWAAPAVELLDRLLDDFGAAYERAKRARGGVDFEDLELLCRDLLVSDGELRARYRRRFARVMVDELQDTNPVQLELIEAVCERNLFTVGDAQQSIYGFRHADVELFAARGRAAARRGRRATLRSNFRSRPEILAVINRVFAAELGDGFAPLVAGRGEADGGEPRVELVVADRDGEWTAEGPAAPWRMAEARALAGRVAELVASGVAAADVVVLLRATTDMRAYERALEEQGVATYTIGGRGYWEHPQVLDMVAYLRVLANPRDEEALYALLGSPLVGASLDALVLLAAAAREARRDPWWVLRETPEALDALGAEERERLAAAAAWLAGERRVAARKGVEELLDRALERTAYDLAVLALPGGQRRLANVRKLMRLGREHLAEHGPWLHGFVELVRLRAQAWRPEPGQSEAPIESEAVDAVRLMTIHRAKGLEFDVVCVADLGRGVRSSAEILRVGADGRLGLRLARPGSGARIPALAYEELGEEQRARSCGEERRLLYVAMTRARERLILSGGTKVEAWGAGGGAPICWLGPALVEDVSGGAGVSRGVAFRVVRPADLEAPPAAPADSQLQAPPPPAGEAAPGPSAGPEAGEAAPGSAPATAPPGIASLSYSSLAAFQRCGYRFYLERVLGVPALEPDADPAQAAGAAAALSAAERGTLVHALLERLDFRRPVLPCPEAVITAAPRPPGDGELGAIIGLVERFAASELCRRLGRATWAAREQRFGFRLGGVLITGTFDVLAGEPPGRSLVVDYKTDRPSGAAPEAVVAREYATQRLIYAVAALRAGAREVEVVHVFLEAPERPASATFGAGRLRELEERLAALAEPAADGRCFPVSQAPHRALCRGCPAEDGLCSWPRAMTRRASPEQLF
jgi:ATP-dependent helicase/nuclease subunit A